MNSWFIRYMLVGLAFLSIANVHAEEKSNVDKARDALAQQGDDEDSTKQLEEVFQAAEKNYSMLKAGGKSLSYSFDYAYTSDSRIDLDVKDGVVRNLDVAGSATHSFTNTFSFDYGIVNNVTLGVRVPLSSRYDTQNSLSATEWGDVSFGLRWQPFAYVPGKATVTANTNISTKTGVSPYEIPVGQRLSTGSGTYAVSAGISVSKVLDPVVIYGSVSSNYSFEQSGLNQVRGGRILKTVHQGQSYSLSGGFSYSLSYDTSLSMSAQMGYSTETTLTFLGEGENNTLRTPDSLSGSMNISLGIRVDPQTITNVSFGFGLTEDASDLNVGLSYPINIGAFNW